MRIPRFTIAAGAAALLTFGIAACGSSSSSSTSTNSSSSTSSGAGDIAAARKLVGSSTQLASSFTAPGPPIKADKAAWSGKTIWYVPVTALPPWFQIQSKVQQSVWSMVGAKVHVCDGQGNPTSISACLRQAVSSKAAAVITDAIPVPFAQDAYTQVVNAKIPVIAGYTDPGATPTTGNFGKYFHGISGEETPTQQLGAAEVIVASGGKAKVMVAGANDTPSAATASKAAISYFKSNCPRCAVDPSFVKTVGNSNLASEVSGQVLKNPGDDYFYTPYEAPSGTVFLQAIRQTGRKMTFMSTAGDTSGLTRIASGAQLGDVGLDPVYQGWNYVDATLRALTGMPSVHYKGLVHLFTKANVPSNPTVAGWLSGSWYSNLAFEAIYKKAWGVS
jgi:ribose transport system substrate-binding protein